MLAASERDMESELFVHEEVSDSLAPEGAEYPVTKFRNVPVRRFQREKVAFFFTLRTN